jgi:NAD(P)-dependent dehydrogenase (short-subunit alcohol dehydrogenase family)
MDVTDQASVAAALVQAVRLAGGPPDILVNNAGIAITKPAIDLTPGDWQSVVDTNLSGAFYTAQAVAQAARDAGRGASIINVASILGLRVAGLLAPYAASKAGLIQLTKALALEWARYGIRVNAIAPGYVETDLNAAFFASEPGRKLIQRIPQRRLGQLADLDGPLLLLASGASAYMTGAVIEVDGGHLVSSL